MSKVISHMAKVMGKAEKNANKLVEEFAGIMANSARSNPDTPRDVPHMIHTIDHHADGLKAFVYTECGYGGFVHEGYSMKGGRHIEGRPFFLWAFQDAKRSI